MTSPDTHTPTPWTYRQRTTTDDLFVIEGENGYGVGRTFSFFDVDQANAAFIVKACNSHDKLVEALREMLAKFPATTGGTGQVDAREQARIVLNQLEGK